MLPSQPDDHAVPRINFNRPARLAIGKHGVDRIRWSSALGRQHQVCNILFQMGPFGARNRSTLANDLERCLAHSFFAHNSCRLQHQSADNTPAELKQSFRQTTLRKSGTTEASAVVPANSSTKSLPRTLSGTFRCITPR